MTKNTQQELEQLLFNLALDVRQNFVARQAYGEGIDREHKLINTALEAINSLVREVWGGYSNPDEYDPDFPKAQDIEDIKLVGQNELRQQVLAKWFGEKS